MTCIFISISFNAFFPTLTATLGYNRTVTLLLCAPPWVLATLFAFAVLRYVLPCSGRDSKFTWDYRHSDATGERSFHAIVPLCIGLVGFVIASSTMNTAARYISL